MQSSDLRQFQSQNLHVFILKQLVKLLKLNAYWYLSLWLKYFTDNTQKYLHILGKLRLT